MSFTEAGPLRRVCEVGRRGRSLVAEPFFEVSSPITLGRPGALRVGEGDLVVVEITGRGRARVAQVFVNHGVIVQTAGRGGHTSIYSANGTAIHGMKVAVLVDGITASAAEVVAGALQRAHAGVVVGTRTYGKGTVQSVWPVPGGGALKLTVAVFRLAGGVPVNGRGVAPNVVSADRPTTPADETLEAALAALARG